VLVIDRLDERLAQRVMNEVIAEESDRPHIAVRTRGGYTLLRERSTTGESV
jgi:hypothetical protein